MNPESSMFQSLVRLRDRGFAPTGILDVGAYQGYFSRGARQIFGNAHILMIDALDENDRGLAFELLKLDVQGAELDVLRGLGLQLSNVEVILVEMSLVDYNKGAPLIDVVLGELRKMGFVLYDIVEQHRYHSGDMLQIDGLFVRPTSRFRAQPPFSS